MPFFAASGNPNLESGGLTQIASTTLSGAATTLSAIPQTYKYLIIQVTNTTHSAGGAAFCVKFNGASTGHYWGNTRQQDTTVSADAAVDAARFYQAGIIPTTGLHSSLSEVFNYTAGSGQVKPVLISSFGYNGTTKYAHTHRGFFNGAAITSVTVEPDVGTFTGGTITIFGGK